MGEEKFGCKLCTKLFRSSEFVVRHIHNKHKSMLEEVEEKAFEDVYAQNYVDEKHQEDRKSRPHGGGFGRPGFGGFAGGYNRGPMGRGGFQGGYNRGPMGRGGFQGGYNRGRFPPPMMAGNWGGRGPPMMMPAPPPCRAPARSTTTSMLRRRVGRSWTTVTSEDGGALLAGGCRTLPRTEQKQANKNARTYFFTPGKPAPSHRR